MFLKWVTWLEGKFVKDAHKTSLRYYTRLQINQDWIKKEKKRKLYILLITKLNMRSHFTPTTTNPSCVNNWLQIPRLPFRHASLNFPTLLHSALCILRRISLLYCRRSYDTVVMGLKSFVQVSPDSHFPLENLPYGVFKPEPTSSPRPGVAIGNHVLDLSVIASAGLFDGPSLKSSDCFNQVPSNLVNLNNFSFFKSLNFLVAKQLRWFFFGLY